MKQNIDSGLSQDYLLEKKFQMMIEQSNHKLKLELDSMNSRLAKMQEDLSELKSIVAQQRSDIIRVQSAPQPAPQPQAVPPSPVQPEPPKRSEIPGRPDPADYKEGEITIEKYFSFAKKR